MTQMQAAPTTKLNDCPGLREYVTLGRSGLRVSPLCLGAMTFGQEWGIGEDEATSVKVIDRYLELGGNFIDTANGYNKGHSEAILGSHLSGVPSKRDRVVIATKWMSNLYRNDPNGGGGHRKAITESVEQSLRRLKTDYIDLLWMHFWDKWTPIEETMRTLDDLVRAGKVRYLGFSDTPAWVCAQAQMIAQFRAWSPLIALQIEYSLVERTVEADLIAMAQSLGMGVTPWSPLKGGILTGKYTRSSAPAGARYKADSKHLNERTFRIVDELKNIAAGHKTQQGQATVAQVALAWVRQRAGVASTIIGARNTGQLEANLASLEVTLNAREMASLDETSEPALPFPHGFLSFVKDAIQNGASVNGLASNVWPNSPADDDERW
ncbi:MAG: aldo/keto reductase [Phycisphaerales bacterium]|nr:aldo/keto reductase [Phycisphaerales bacterium]